MAIKGKPLPADLVREIVILVPKLGLKHTARLLDVDRNTARRYARAAGVAPQGNPTPRVAILATPNNPRGEP
jgi:hypothetical protein